MIWIDVQRGIDLSRRFLIFMLVEEHKREYPVSKGLIWIERDGPPVKEPLRSGFGSTLIREGFAAQLGGSATLAFEPDGLTCVLEFPLRRR